MEVGFKHLMRKLQQSCRPASDSGGIEQSCYVTAVNRRGVSLEDGLTRATQDRCLRKCRLEFEILHYCRTIIGGANNRDLHGAGQRADKQMSTPRKLLACSCFRSVFLNGRSRRLKSFLRQQMGHKSTAPGCHSAADRRRAELGDGCCDSSQNFAMRLFEAKRRSSPRLSTDSRSS